MFEGSTAWVLESALSAGLASCRDLPYARRMADPDEGVGIFTDAAWARAYFGSHKHIRAYDDPQGE